MYKTKHYVAAVILLSILGFRYTASDYFFKKNYDL